MEVLHTTPEDNNTATLDFLLIAGVPLNEPMAATGHCNEYKEDRT
jgi:hypothetical protein